MHTVATIVMIIGAIGFALAYASIITIAPLMVWGGIAVAGMVVTVMTRRPSD